MQEFRKDLVTGRCTIISTERARRPQQRIRDISSPDAEPCPFCPGNEQETPPEVLAYRVPDTPPDSPGWSVRVVPNKYPAVRNDEPAIIGFDSLYKGVRAVGVHEVIIEVPEHVANMAQFGNPQIVPVLRAYRERMLALRQDPRWRYILVYKNQGASAGATLEHAHSQLIALPEIPPAVVQEINGAREYFISTRRCGYCDMVQQELSERKRVVTESERFLVFCPYAARLPYETWIVPKRHSPLFEDCAGDECDELSGCLKETLVRLDRSLDNPSLNFMIHSNAVGAATSTYYHWHLEILPKITQIAGFEWGSGSFMNPLAPEDAARVLRTIAV
jgi:UDPglucose--hexose-1-phosphate uridylyltransferase